MSDARTEIQNALRHLREATHALANINLTGSKKAQIDTVRTAEQGIIQAQAALAYAQLDIGKPSLTVVSCKS